MVGGYACKRSEMTVLVAKRWQDMLLVADSRTDFLSFLFFGSYSSFWSVENIPDPSGGEEFPSRRVPKV